MRTTGLAIMGAAALVAVGYAFYMLAGPSPAPAPVSAQSEASEPGSKPRPVTGPRPRAEVRSVPSERARAPGPARAPSSDDAAPAMVGPPAGAPTIDAPPRPPDVSLAEAREQFAAYMAELQRLEDDGATLPSPEWVEAYKRGNDLLLPLQQQLDLKVPAEAEELRRANEGMRTTLQSLQPGPVPL